MFAIYFPGKTGATVEHFRAADLHDLLDDDSPSFADLAPGPDGGHGMAATWSPGPIIPAAIDWTKSGGVWLGKTAEQKLAPADFQRRQLHYGADVRMADGHEWHIPIARQLPHLLALDDAGRWVGRVDARYQRFWDAAWAALDWFAPDSSGTCAVDFQAGAEFVALALSINYRVNARVSSWLGLIRSDLFWPVARAATDFDSLIAAQQKKTPEAAAAGLSTSAGGAD